MMSDEDELFKCQVPRRGLCTEGAVGAETQVAVGRLMLRVVLEKERVFRQHMMPFGSGACSGIDAH